MLPKPRAAALLLLFLAACAPAAVDGHDDGPGLHTMMVDLQYRHATVWFAGAAGNWPLADYHVHEIEELTAEIAEQHPTYDDMPIADLMSALLMPAVEALAAAVDTGEAAAFEAAYDRLTAQCNACHESTNRGVIVIQRPRTPPMDNVRFEPVAAPAGTAVQ
jgi:hypothetical protein